MLKFTSSNRRNRFEKEMGEIFLLEGLTGLRSFFLVKLQKWQFNTLT